MKIITTICLCIIFHQACAQNNKIDSLNRLISKAVSDTGRINLLNSKASELSKINIDTAILLGTSIVAGSKKIKYKKGEAIARIKLASNYCFKGEFAAAEENLKEAEVIFTSLKDSLYISRVYAGYGMFYGMQSKYDSAMQYYKNSIGIDERNGNKEELSRSYNNLAISYQMRSDFAQALLYQQKSLQIAESRNDVAAQSHTLLNIGLNYKTIGDSVRSEQYLLKAVDLAKKSGTKNVELYAYSNLATLYESQHKLDKSYDYAIQSAELGAAMGDQGIQSAGLSKAASARAGQGKFEEAKKLAAKSIEIADSSHQPLNIYQTYNIMGYILKKEQRYPEAIPFFEKAFDALKGADIFDEQVGVSYNELSECYEKTGNYSKALSAYKMAAQIADSISSKENIRTATEQTMNYDFEKKQQAAAAEQKQKDAVASANQIALLVGLVLTGILCIFGFIGYRNKRKAHSVLKRQKERIEQTLTQLRATQAQLIQAEKMASLGELTAGIAHEIQNPLNFVNNFSEVNNELIEELDDLQKQVPRNLAEENEVLANIKKNLEKINHHGKRADAIVKGMLQHSRSSTGQKEPTDINALTDEYLRLSYHGLRARDKAFNATLQTDFDKNIGTIAIVPQDIGRVILNLITNAFYSVAAKKQLQQQGYQPTVFTGTKKLADTIEIRIRDNGMGIPQKILDKIFQPFFTTKPAGEGTGLGLSLSYDIITKAHGGSMQVVTKEGEFAEFIIVLPVA